MLHRFTHDKKSIQILPEGYSDNGENTITVVVGQNGVGKSRLLADITSDIIRVAEQDSYFIEEVFSRIIAVSTSPFDRFPLHKRNTKNIGPDYYRYFGMRGRGFGNVSSVTLLSSAASALIERFAKGEFLPRLQDTFELLGFAPEIDLVFKKAFDPFSQLSLHEYRSAMHDTILKDVGNTNITLADFDTATEFLIELSQFAERSDNFVVHMDFVEQRASIRGVKGGGELVRKIQFLLERNFIRLMDLRLQKHGYGVLSLRRASSGEQCIIVSILSIAASIRNRSLMLIDEPEISLHPSWQEKYISLLSHTFQGYKSCQFIIATHSPQIIANLPKAQCFILSLSKCELYESKDFSNRSSDFQLAELFGAPGTNNEYLSRVALNLFIKITKKKVLSEADNSTLIQLIKKTSALGEEDKVKELVDAICKVRNHYADDKKRV